MFRSRTNLVTKWFTVFEAKKTPDRIPLSRASMQDADMYEVYLRKEGKDNGYLFVRKDGNKLEVKEYCEERDS